MDQPRHVGPNGRTLRLRLFALGTIVIVSIVCTTILVALGNDTVVGEAVSGIGFAAVGALAGMRS